MSASLNAFPGFVCRLDGIRRVDEALESAARAHLDDLTKPRGSLGRLEDIAARLFMISGGHAPLCVEPSLVIVASGDHGVAEEGISAFPQEVTGQMLRNILEGGAGISVLSRLNGMEMLAVDAGGIHDALSEAQYPQKSSSGQRYRKSGPHMRHESGTVRQSAGLWHGYGALCGGAGRASRGHGRNGHRQYHACHRAVLRVIRSGA